MAVRAIRGAISVESNTKEKIFEATNELLAEMVKRNDINREDMIAMFFTMTKDLNAYYPAAAAREIGYTDVPLVCYAELEIENSLRMCLRIMIQVNTEKTNAQIKHVYLKDAKVLRKDLAD